MAMKWDDPFYSRMPTPIGMVQVSDYEMPLMPISDRILSPGLHDKGIEMYGLGTFCAPPGSGKRVPAEEMLEDALRNGIIKPGGILVEPTSGGTGLALAFLAKRYNITVVAIVSDRLPEGKRLPLLRQGATVLTESEAVAFLGLERSPGSQTLARLYAEKTGAVFLNQYWNEGNPGGWKKHVAPPVWELIGSDMTEAFFILGSTGAMRGLGSYFKEQNPDIKIAVTMPYISQEIAGARDRKRLKEVAPWEHLVDFQDATDFRVARDLSTELFKITGIPGGESSGGTIGLADHYYLGQLERGELKKRSVAFMLFIDTFVPYVKMA